MNILAWSSRAKTALVAATVAAIAAAHFFIPFEPLRWYWVHVLYHKLYYVPLLLAAFLLGPRRTLLTAVAVTAIFAGHLVLDWKGDPINHADQIGDMVTIWVVAVTAMILFDREWRALESTRKAHEESLAVLASSLEMREQETMFHSRRVQEYTTLIANRMGISEEALREQIRAGALFHDVGKIGIPDRILLKEELLTKEERKEVQAHPELGAALIGRIGFLDDAREMVLAHHERYDGMGYPRGIAGDTIPVGARIFAVADTFDALTTDRPYRVAASYEEAREEVRKGRGSHFDPAVVDAFLQVPFTDWALAALRNGVTLRRA